MKVCKVKITASSVYDDKITIKGRNLEPIRDELQKSGFRAGDLVVIITQKEYDKLLKGKE